MLPPIIIQIALIVFIAFIGGYIANKLGVSVLLGYILAGLAIGFTINGGVIDGKILNSFSEVGIALLLFSLGLDFKIEHLKQLGFKIILGVLCQVGIVLVFGFFLFPALFNISYLEALFISGALSVASTAVVGKILYDRGLLNSVFGELALGWLIIQDLLVLPLLLFLDVSYKVINSSNFSLFGVVVFPVLKIGLVLYLALILGRKTLPFIFKYLAFGGNRELLLLGSFSFAIIFAYISNILGVSFALGAFLAGLALSGAVVNHEISALIRPIKDLFSLFFYLYIGILASWQFNTGSFYTGLVIFFISSLIKVLAVFFISKKIGFHGKIAFYTALALFGVGEFSFVIGKIGQDLGVISENMFTALTFCTVFSLVATPFVVSSAHKLLIFIKINTPKKILEKFKGADFYKSYPVIIDNSISDHIIIVGFGRVGREIASILDYAKKKFVVIDYNYKNLKDLRSKGKPFVYGDAVNEEILISAGIHRCKAIVIAIPDVKDSEIILDHCLKLNPDAKFIARAHKDIDAARLKVRGVSAVIEPEFEASLMLVRHALYSLEMTIEEIETFLAKARRGYRF